MNTKAEKLYVGKAPRGLVDKMNTERAAQRQKNRARLLDEISKTKFEYYCSVCLIIRDENEYLEEWLKWHIGQGVEHFYIYDHGSKQAVKEFIKTLGKEIADKVTVIEWCGEHKNAQPEAYNDCLKRFGRQSRWIGFIDADEQVRVKTNQTLPEFLQGYEEYAGVMAVWILYNANGQIKKTNGTLRERFTRVSRDHDSENHMGKVFVQPLFMRDMVIHNGAPQNGFILVDEHKKHVSPYSPITADGTQDYICVDHYYTKSYEEWLQKIARGSGDAMYQRRYRDFFNINPDMEYCRENIKIRQQYNCSNQ